MASKGSVYEGKTYEEAVARGLEELGLTRAEAIVTTIEEGKGGFLGIGSRPYRVSVSRRPGGAIREPEDGGERRRGRGAREERGGRGARGGRDERRESRGGERGGRAGREERGGRGGREGREGREGRGAGREGREERRPQPAAAQAPRAEERREGRREDRRDERRDERRGGVREERREGARDERREGAREERREGAREERREGAREERREGAREERREGRRDERREPRREEPVRSETRPQAEDVELRVPAPPEGAGPMGAGADGDEGGDDRRRRRRRGRRGGRGRRREGAPGAESHATTNGAAPADGFVDAIDADEPEAEAPMLSIPAPVEPAPAMMASAPAPAPGSAAAPAPAPLAAPALASRPHGERESESDDRAPHFTEAELAETSRALTSDLLATMGFEATVVVSVQGTRADVTAEVAQDDDLLTGRKGEVRQALQHLLNRFLNRGEGSRYHLQLEINDFWKRREQELEDLARSLADEAANNRAEVVTEYLNSQERRIVHVTLKEDPRVRTYALGTGMIKRVAVAPADFPERTGDEEA